MDRYTMSAFSTYRDEEPPSSGDSGSESLASPNLYCDDEPEVCRSCPLEDRLNDSLIVKMNKLYVSKHKSRRSRGVDSPSQPGSSSQEGGSALLDPLTVTPRIARQRRVIHPWVDSPSRPSSSSSQEDGSALLDPLTGSVALCLTPRIARQRRVIHPLSDDDSTDSVELAEEAPAPVAENREMDTTAEAYIRVLESLREKE